KTSLSLADYENYQPKKWHMGGIENAGTDEEDEENLSGNGKLILVMDDIKDMRNLIVRSLKTKSYRFMTASNGEIGLQKMKRHKPDLVIIDWMMPKLSGPEVIEQMLGCDDLKSVPTILLTAKSDEESKMEGIGKGAHAYLAKPFNEIELLTTVENLIHLKEGEDRIRELNRNLTENVLKRFLPHKLVDDIVSGRKTIDDKPKSMDITILFTDLFGFASKAEDLGAYISSIVLNEFFDCMTRVIFEFDGTIDKFTGDGIMVVFGAPEAQTSEIQVERAIKCAIAMQAALKNLNRSWHENHNLEFSMRIGIHRGSGIVGSFGGEKRSEYTVIGPVVNMASRIEQLATPGRIFFSSSVRDYITVGGWSKAGVFDLRGIGEISLFKLDDLDNVKTA
ncbi:MAG: adenylate/guanylate cyclase domain-containing response regulator, partial [Oligoflexales bacterium]|nr:adenylate/guanylate cyclase domain-containing response regulator [Oligoflexales bacterium]